MMERLSRIFSYISEAVGRIFSPITDHYPATGALPYEGDTHHSSKWAD
ncbi:isochorismate synthase [Lyngbya confervoides]|uniref:Isochorismate synthase n=1 Tax=Lyngbya confervoides BDU141951 TaxID=1574623 RepID=A0ABD4T210_9CYAN|nr:isochorismate synthase [Lyngbya confervoides]MCM1982689.1 isochorismate synthase [Lyngbya confervoides BDU141951]